MNELIKRLNNILILDSNYSKVIYEREKYLEVKLSNYDSKCYDYYDYLLYEQKIITKYKQYIEFLYKMKEILLKAINEKIDLKDEFSSIFNDINTIYYENYLDVTLKDIIESKNRLLETVILNSNEEFLPVSIDEINKDIIFLEKFHKIYNNIIDFFQFDLLIDERNGDYVVSKSQPTKREKFIYEESQERESEAKPTKREKFVYSTSFENNNAKETIKSEPEVVSFITGPSSFVQVKNVKKARNWKKCRNSIKKHAKSIIASVMVLTIGLASGIGINLSARQSNKEDKDNSINNVKYTEKVKDTPLDTTPTEEVTNKNNDDEKTKKEEKKTEKIERNVEINEEVIEPVAENLNYQVGDEITFEGDQIYVSSFDVKNNTNGLEPYYPIEDERTISAIEYVSPSKDDYEIIIKDLKKAEELIEDGWSISSICMDNNTNDINNEGWVSVDDVKLKVKQR